MTKKALILTAIIFLFLGKINAQTALTLEQSIEIALENNRNVRRQELTRQAREIAFNQARQDLLPNLNASARQNFMFGRSLNNDNVFQSANSSQTTFGVSAGITLFDGLRLRNNIHLQRAEMHASEADLQRMKSDITLSVTASFLQVLMNKELLQLAEEQLSLTQARIEERRVLIESGRLPEGELFELKAQAAREEFNRVQADNSLRLSLLDLAQILELDDFRNLSVVMPENLNPNDILLPSAETVYTNALRNRPEIRSAEYRLQSSERSVAIARSGFSPTLSLGGNFGSAYRNISGFENASFSDQMSANMSTGVGLNLSIPIFNRFETQNRVRNAQLNVEHSRLSKENTRLELRKTIQQAYQNALAAKSRWNAAGQTETAAREAYRFVSQRFENGRATQFELFQAKNNLTQALSEQTQAKFEYIFRVKILEILSADR